MQEYHTVVQRIRSFFIAKGFIEVPVQSRLSILAACEDPFTISTFNFDHQVWPLPQTGQMWLEYELLQNPGVPGVFCVSTSYRDEPNPVPGRHDKIFPMFEFESRGGLGDLIQLEKALLAHMGFKTPCVEVGYEDVCLAYGVPTLEGHHETRMATDYSTTTFLKHFPLRTHPFWNMRQLDDNLFAKVDVILHGMETIGSAERSCNVDEMRHNFYHISDGGYAQRLFDLFGRDRVEEELNRFLGLTMVPRFGGGMGITRMIRAMKLEGLMS